jgi:hypothetical protein
MYAHETTRRTQSCLFNVKLCATSPPPRLRTLTSHTGCVEQEQNGAHNASSEAADFLVLQRLLTELFPSAESRPKIVGPDPHGWHGAPKPGDEKLTFLNEFASECRRLGVELFALTHHEYIELGQDSPDPPPASKLGARSPLQYPPMCAC